MDDNFVYYPANDCRICSCAYGLHKINKKRSESANEHVSKQNGLELRKLN